MKQILFAGLMMVGFLACNDNGTTNSGDTTPDSAYNNPTATDTGQGMQPSDTADSLGRTKPGAGTGTGSGTQATQDTGSGTRYK